MEYLEQTIEEYINGFIPILSNISNNEYLERIVVEKDDEIVFVEVKTAAGKTLGEIEDQVDELKLQRLSDAIDKYLMDNEIEKDIRLDVYAVRLGKNGPILKHFKGIELE